MSKSQDAKKETKKPAAKTLKEKRAEKKAKKADKRQVSFGEFQHAERAETLPTRTMIRGLKDLEG